MYRTPKQIDKSKSLSKNAVQCTNKRDLLPFSFNPTIKVPIAITSIESYNYPPTNPNMSNIDSTMQNFINIFTVLYIRNTYVS